MPLLGDLQHHVSLKTMPMEGSQHTLLFKQQVGLIGIKASRLASSNLQSSTNANNSKFCWLASNISCLAPKEAEQNVLRCS